MSVLDSRYDFDQAAGGERLTPQLRMTLLTEWRDALVKIVENEPGAVETRKTISAIDEQIAELQIDVSETAGKKI